MENKKKFECCGCGCKVNKLKQLKKLNGGFFCKDCVREKRAKHREYLLREVCGIRKRSDILKEFKERIEKQEKLRRIVSKEIPIKPSIKSIRKNKPKISFMGLYLTRNEKLILYKKLTQSGLSSEEANKRINNITKKLKILVEKLRQAKKTPKEQHEKFQEGFARLCEETE